ncbi:hypothetical protein B1J92_E02079g [Nakaseomyces glabratus]|nr:hypothetical protein B1J91_E02079g [Nakaseomyces glabratus]OXB49617.1 hypothetical protein B1J92_E02079g [Nakaseomyces glabratus]
MNREGISGPGGAIITHDSVSTGSSSNSKNNGGNNNNSNIPNGNSSMGDDIMVLSRINDIERRMMMFENMFHALSGRLDHHFKKYDVLVSSQQQQISELNAVITTLLNDQYRHAEFVRDKLSHSLHGISSTSISLNGISNQNNDNRSNGFANNNSSGVASGSSNGVNSQGNTNNNSNRSSSTSHLNNPNMLGNNSSGTGNNHNNNSVGASNSNQSVTHTILDDILNEHDLQDKKYSGNRNPGDMNSRNDVNDKSQQSPRDPMSLKKTKFIHHRQYNDVTDGDSVIPYTNPYVDQSGHQQNNLTSNILFNDSTSGQNAGNQGTQQATQNREEGMPSSPGRKSYSSKRGPKKKKVMYHKPFQFIKSPHSVMEIWKEYTEGIDGQPSIREMESLYLTGWRRDAAVNKRYSRRKVLWKAIETGLSRGYTLDYIIDLLENYRIIDPEKNTKQPIGWLCQVNNIPDLLK